MVNVETPVRALHKPRKDLEHITQVAADPSVAVLREQSFAVEYTANGWRILWSVPDLIAEAADLDVSAFTPTDLLPKEIQLQKKREQREWLAGKYGLGRGIRDTVTFDITAEAGNIVDAVIYRSRSRSMCVDVLAPPKRQYEEIMRAESKRDGNRITSFSFTPTMHLAEAFRSPSQSHAVSWLSLVGARLTAKVLEAEGIAGYLCGPTQNSKVSDRTYAHISQPLRETGDLLNLRQLGAAFGYAALTPYEVQIASPTPPQEVRRKQIKRERYLNRRQDIALHW